MKITNFLIAGMALGTVACSSSPERRDEGFVPDGNERGDSVYRKEEQVTKTVTRERELPTVRSNTVKGDLNRMEEEHFEVLGFSKDLAERVVDYRDDHGDFRAVEELRQVPGMDEALYLRVKDKLAAVPTG